DLVAAREKGIEADDTLAAVGETDDFNAPRHLGDLADPLIGKLLDDLEQAIADDTGDYDHLHQIRIKGKRLRYAMEVVVACFAPEFRDEVYPAVEEMQ